MGSSVKFGSGIFQKNWGNFSLSRKGGFGARPHFFRSLIFWIIPKVFAVFKSRFVYHLRRERLLRKLMKYVIVVCQFERVFVQCSRKRYQ